MERTERKALDRFDGRAALRTWLHRIATNVCLDAFAERSARTRPFEMGPVGSTDDALIERYVAAFEAFDVTSLTALMREDAKTCMPPYSLRLQRLIGDWTLETDMTAAAFADAA